MFVTATGQVAVSDAGTPLVGVIAGRVTDRANGQPVEAAQVVIDGTRLGGSTGTDGRFTIPGVPAGAHRVTVRRIGYEAASVPVIIADGETANVTVGIAHSAVSLSEVVVTAAGTERTREMGNSVSILDLNAERAPILNAQELLGGRVPGATVLGNSGQAGQGGTIRLRGVNSISQGNSPIIYVDGIRMSNARTPNSVGGHGDVSPLNDIDMADVERMEVVKGPAATTLYDGSVRRRDPDLHEARPWQWPPDVTRCDLGLQQHGAHRRRVGHDGHVHQSMRWRALAWRRNEVPGRDLSSQRNVPSRRPDQPRLRGPSRLDAHQRLLPLRQLRGRPLGTPRRRESRGGVRGNITVRATPKLSVALNSSFVKRDVRWFPDGLSSNAFLLNVSRGSGSFFKGPGCSDPTVVCVLEDSIFTVTNTTGTNHFITGGTATWTPVDPLSVRLSTGYDYNVADMTDITPFGHLRVPLGSLAESQWNRTLITTDLAATYKHALGAAIGTTTSIGGQTFDSRLNQTDLTSSNFSSPGVPTLTSGSLRNITNVTQQRVINAGFFGQEQLAWRDRLFVTGGLRVDGNSAFGEGFGLQRYPKVSAAYVISDEPFWSPRWIETLKLRAALGESGKAPGAFDAVRTWDPVAAENGQSAFEPDQIGNPNLGPERTRETELGFDASTLNGRLTVTFSHYSSRTNGALVPVVLPPSLGFANRQLENIGVLMNHGTELAVNAQVITTAHVDVNAGIQYSTVVSEAGDLGGQTITVDANSLSFVQQGLPAPSYIGDRITNPDAIADPVVEKNVFLGGTFPTKIISPRLTVRLWNRVSLDALGEFDRGGHLLNSIGFANEGLFSWQPCFATQAKLRAFAAGNTAALNDVTAGDRGRCAIASAVRDAGFWVESNDFFKLRSFRQASTCRTGSSVHRAQRRSRSPDRISSSERPTPAPIRNPLTRALAPSRGATTTSSRRRERSSSHCIRGSDHDERSLATSHRRPLRSPRRL